MAETQGNQEGSRNPRPRRDDILARIVATKREEVGRLAAGAEELRARALEAAPARDFHGVLADPARLSLIAEVKRRSPGAGAIREDLDPIVLARRYVAGGARALSILTDREYFGGSLEDLARIREAVEVPCLRKDFILDPVQLYEARAEGADATLLIVRILDDGELRELRLLAEELGMSALVEVHDGEELERAMASGARILGINNRDLSSFRTDLAVTLELLARVPEEVVLVSESGIWNGEDAARLAAAGVDAILVGEALVRAERPEELARALTPLRPVPRHPGAPESSEAEVGRGDRPDDARGGEPG